MRDNHHEYTATYSSRHTQDTEVYDVRTSTLSTQTRRVFSTQQLDAEGFLSLRIPCGSRLAHAVVKVEIHIEEPVPDTPLSAEELGWPPGFFEETYGAFQDEPIEREVVVEWEKRENVV